MRKWTVGLLLLLILGACGARKDSPENKITRQSDVRIIDGTLAAVPELGSDEDDAWAFVQMKEYPGVTFVIKGITYRAFDAALFQREVHPGDSIWIGIHRANTAIQKGEAQVEKMIPIEPYSIDTRTKSYMSLARVNEIFAEEGAANKWLFYWVVGMAIAGGLIYIGLYLTGGLKKIREWAGKRAVVGSNDRI